MSDIGNGRAGRADVVIVGGSSIGGVLGAGAASPEIAKGTT
jgi:hypothetical protein